MKADPTATMFATADEICATANATIERPTARLRYVERDVPATDGESNFLVRGTYLQQQWLIEGADFARHEWRDVPVEAEGEA